jgi:hypothetical protein
MMEAAEEEIAEAIDRQQVVHRFEIEPEVLSEPGAFVHVNQPLGHRFTYIFIGTRKR